MNGERRIFIDALLLDLDGTLTDPYLGISRCVLHACERMGEPVPQAEYLRTFIGPPLQSSFAAMFNGNIEKVERAMTIYRDRFSETGLLENTVYDGIPACLKD